MSTNKKTFLFVVPLPPPFAGPEMATQTLIDSSLQEHIDIVCLRNNMHSKNAQKGKITFYSISALILLSFKMIGALSWKKFHGVYTLLSQNFSGLMRDSLLVLIAKTFRKKTILHFRGSNFQHFYQNQSPLMKKYILFILNLADTIILEADWLRKVFQKFVPLQRLHVIYNPAPFPSFPADRNLTFCHQQGIHVLFMNHLSVAKGFLILAKAMQNILAQNSNIRFTIVGDVIERELNIFHDQNGDPIFFEAVQPVIQKLKQDHHLNEKIKFLGVISGEQKQRLLREADIFVLPSYSEGCPISVLEAMAAGLALIVTRVGALPELLSVNKNGLFVKMGDPNDLVEKIEILAKDPALRKEMGRQNQWLIESKLNINKLVPQFVNIFHKTGN